MKLRKQFHLQYHTHTHKYSEKINKRTAKFKLWKLQNITINKDSKWNNWDHRFENLLGWRYSLIDPQILQSPYYYPSWLLYRNWWDDTKIHMEIQEFQNSQSNLAKEESWKTHTSQFQNLLETSKENQESGNISILHIW